MERSFGTLAVRVYTAGGALPVEGATVRISSGGEVLYSLPTDRDGLTERVRLPAPSTDLSLSPAPESIPYATYDVTVDAEGFERKIIHGVSVFSGIDSIQLVNLIPNSGDTRSENEIFIPKYNDLE